MTIFNRAEALAELRGDRMVALARTYAPGHTFSDDYLWSKLLSAERAVERALRIDLAPREVVPDTASDTEVAALTGAGETVIREPGYDYDPELFRGDSWGLIVLRRRPTIRVNSIVFAYPGPGDTIWSVPIDWIRGDKKYGRVNIVPTQSAAVLPLNSYLLSVMGAGRHVPLMMQIRYRCGIEDVEAQHPDLVDLVKQMAVLGVIDGLFMPQSGSVSADGLSQSLSIDTSKLREALDGKLERFRQDFSGPRVAFM